MRSSCRAYALLSALVLGLVLPNAPGYAQGRDASATQLELSRSDLEALLAKYEADIQAPAYSTALRAEARREAELIRARLAEGDFQIGDQISLVVEGEDTLSRTFVVQQGPSVVLPTVGSISLRGVLRSELESQLRRELSRFIRDPVVQVRSSIRIMVTGAVGRGGYYVVPTDMVLSDVFSTAGGPTPDARLDQVRIERGNQPIWSGEALQRAIIEGRTLDQLGFRAGDQVVVPQRTAGGAWQSIQPVLLGLGSVVTLIGLFLR